MNDRHENASGSASKSGFHKTQSGERSEPISESDSLPEARKIGKREAEYLYAERPVFDAVQVEFCA